MELTRSDMTQAYETRSADRGVINVRNIYV
jgi:hypothetical protein